MQGKYQFWQHVISQKVRLVLLLRAGLVALGAHMVQRGGGTSGSGSSQGSSSHITYAPIKTNMHLAMFVSSLRKGVTERKRQPEGGDCTPLTLLMHGCICVACMNVSQQLAPVTHAAHRCQTPWWPSPPLSVTPKWRHTSAYEHAQNPCVAVCCASVSASLCVNVWQVQTVWL